MDYQLDYQRKYLKYKAKYLKSRANQYDNYGQYGGQDNESGDIDDVFQQLVDAYSQPEPEQPEQPKPMVGLPPAQPAQPVAPAVPTQKKEKSEEDIEEDIKKLLEEMSPKDIPKDTPKDTPKEPEKPKIDSHIKGPLDEIKKEILKTYKEIKCCGNNINSSLIKTLDPEQQKSITELKNIYSIMQNSILSFGKQFNQDLDNIVDLKNLDEYFSDNYIPYLKNILNSYHSSLKILVNQLESKKLPYYILRHRRDRTCNIMDKDCCDHTIDENCFLQLANQSLVRLQLPMMELPKEGYPNITEMNKEFMDKLFEINDLKKRLDAIGKKHEEFAAMGTTFGSIGRKSATALPPEQIVGLPPAQPVAPKEPDVPKKQQPKKKRSSGFFGLFKRDSSSSERSK
jgi:hypothetical protein